MTKLFQEYEQEKAVSKINGKYRVYCIDDIHFFADDFPLQEKFIIFLDACLYEKKQFICACSESLASHKGLSESLRSRLELGLTVELKNPDLDVRMRFIQAQCILHHIDISREHMLLLAQHCKHLRYLSGVLLKIAAYKKFTRQEITKQDIEKIIQYSGEYSPLSPHDIISRVAEYFSLSLEDLMGNKRKPALVFARQTAMYLCRDILGTSYPALGKIFGGKDHSTVIYSIKKIEKYTITNKNAHTEITELKNICAQRKNKDRHELFYSKQS
jgi:chromosomal replication initiator protein